MLFSLDRDMLDFSLSVWFICSASFIQNGIKFTRFN